MPYKNPAENLARSKARYAAMSAEQREARRAYRRAYYQANKDRARAQVKAWRDRNGHGDRPQTERAGHLRRKYGITPERYDELLAAQNGRCAGCSTTDPGDTYFHVDHDHETGEVRGLLCKSCNLALGMVADSVETLMGLAAYLLSNQSVLKLEDVSRG